MNYHYSARIAGIQHLAAPPPPCHNVRRVLGNIQHSTL